MNYIQCSLDIFKFITHVWSNRKIIFLECIHKRIDKLKKRNDLLYLIKDNLVNPEKKILARKIYLLLASLFITSLVVSNLIFQKFFYWYPFKIEIFGIASKRFRMNPMFKSLRTIITRCFNEQGCLWASISNHAACYRWPSLMIEITPTLHNISMTNSDYQEDYCRNYYELLLLLKNSYILMHFLACHFR